MNEIPEVEPGDEMQVGDTLYINPVPYKVHEHEFEEIEPDVWQCKHCAQGRLGKLKSS